MGPEAYQCWNPACLLEWNSGPGPQAPCRKCGSKYCSWVTFKEFIERNKCH